MSSYKSVKEGFVSDTTGSSVLHVNLVSAVALSSIALHSALSSRLPTNQPLHFTPEWVILTLPLLLSITYFANMPALLSVILLLPTGVLMLVPPRESGTPLPSGYTSAPRTPPPPPYASLEPELAQPSEEPSSKEKSLMITPLPALTTYRAHMILMTILCILAVDFQVFPRALAKCETWGVSLMDLGVGSFVFSQGIVSAIPLLRDPSCLTAPLIPKLVGVARKSLPLLALGLVRVILVKGTEYPEHESEYGTHWNFFITMGLMPVLQTLLHPLMTHFPVSLVGVFVAIAHQMALTIFGWQNLVLYAPRTGLVSSNKEGLVSLFGYLSIHLLGLCIGTMLVPPSPNYFRRQLQQANGSYSRVRAASSPPSAFQRQDDKTATELCAYAVVWWAGFAAMRLLGIGGDVSRRMANLQYILWVAAFNSTFLFCYLLLDLYFFPSPLSKSIYSPTSKLKITPPPPSQVLSSRTRELHPPQLLEAINKNGLVLFLLANVVTGLVNMSMQTMYVSDAWAMCVLGAYAFVMCAVAWVSRRSRILRI